MKAGQLRHRGTIQVSERANNSQGNSVVTWRTVAGRLPCRVEDNGSQGASGVFGLQLQEDITHRVSLRWNSNVKSGMRFIWHDVDEDREMTITARPFNPDGRRDEMVLICKEPQ